MSDTPSRLLNLLSLLQSPREWPGSELAERLRVSPRTVRRDVERLRDLGYPVEATRGAEGGYRLVAGAAMPPLLLDDEEAVAIAVGLRAAAGHAVAGVEEASVRALGKLQQVLPTRLRRRVSALNTATVSFSWSAPTVDPERLTALAAVIANREKLRFRYRDDRRLVEPNRLVSAGRHWYFVAFDDDRGDWRTFRVDRMSDLQPIGARFAARELPGGDAAAFVTSRLSSLAPTYPAVVTLHLPAGRVPSDQFGEVEPITEHSCLLRAGGDTLEWLAFRLVQLGCEFEVHEPPELVEHLRDLGARLARATSGGGGGQPAVKR